MNYLNTRPSRESKGPLIILWLQNAVLTYTSKCHFHVQRCCLQRYSWESNMTGKGENERDVCIICACLCVLVCVKMWSCSTYTHSHGESWPISSPLCLYSWVTVLCCAVLCDQKKPQTPDTYWLHSEQGSGHFIFSLNILNQCFK